MQKREPIILDGPDTTMYVPHTFRISALALWASSHAVALESWTGRVHTPTPPYTPTNTAAPECTGAGASMFVAKPRPTGRLETALSEASVAMTEGPPALPCSVITALPTSVQGDFASLETKWSDWWHSTR